jgi:protein phosphatase
MSTDVSTPDPDTSGAPVLAIPDLALVVLVGISGSGKSTFARTHFRPTQVLSSDVCRGLVADDENDQTATPAAFDVLHHIAATRLRAGRLTVVDATSVKREDRAKLVQLARDHDVLPVAIVWTCPEGVAVERNAARADRDLNASVLRRQRADLRRGMRGMSREGFRKVHVLDGVEQIDAAAITYEKQYNDRRDDAGPFDVIGDVHGCRAELEQLLTELGYELVRDEQGRPVDAAHSDGRRAVFVGDLVDRGPDSPGVLRLVMGMVGAGHALCVPGNHEHKLVKALRGRNVRISHGPRDDARAARRRGRGVPHAGRGLLLGPGQPLRARRRQAGRRPRRARGAAAGPVQRPGA